MVDDSGTRRERLRKSAARLRTLEDERRVEQARRDELVRLLRDEDESWRSISRDAGVSIARCVAIVAGELRGVQRAPCRTCGA